MNNGLLQPSAQQSVAQKRVRSQRRLASRGKVIGRSPNPNFIIDSRVQPVVNFYLVRHGDALSAAENPQRPLSCAGRHRVERTAQLALARHVQVPVIYHSGILRAKETAEILAACLMPVPHVAQLSGLLPEDDPAIVEAELAIATASILLVGHLPFMSRLAGLLVNRDPERPVTEFSPAAMVCVSRSAAQWEMRWRIAP